MNPIASIVSSIAPLSIPGPVAIALPPPPALFAPADAADIGGSSVVELSGLGQTLAALSSFEARLPQSDAGDAAAAVAEARRLADAFNALQGRLAGVLAATGEPVSARLAQDLDTTVTGSFENGGAPLVRLSQVGIAFEPAPAGVGGRLTVDADRLRSAFAADAGATRSLLAGALEALSGLAASYAGPGGTIPSTLAQVGQGSALAAEAALDAALDAGPTLADFLALESLGQGLATGVQRMLAIGEFNLVDSLLGGAEAASP